MAAYNSVSKVIGTTAAEGQGNVPTLITAQNAAVATAVTAALAVNGYLVGTLTISPAQLVLDDSDSIMIMTQTLVYQTYS